jgi:phosphoribosylamine--glycine ligase
MRLLVLGSGGREHAIAWRLSRDGDVSSVLVAPGNPGIPAIGRCVPVDITDPAQVLDLARREAIDLTVVGPEAALERGVADRFRDAGLLIVGPSRHASALECSKVYAKGFMADAGIPTARFCVCRTAAEAFEAVSGEPFGFPVVVKADGLAAGKGVTVAGTRDEAEAAVRTSMIDQQFGAAGSTLVIEECLTGPEVSLFVLCDGERAVPLGSAQDHKRIFDGDLGPNTGGMGAFAPSPLVSAEMWRGVMSDIVQPVIQGMRPFGGYHGFLYVSLMLTPTGPKVIEFNVRFGDPEAQVIMPMLEGPFARTLHDSATGRLGPATVREGAGRCVGVVLAAGGYPGSLDTGRPIAGLDQAAALPDVLVFHAGTRTAGGDVVTAGGRVLTVVGKGATYESAMAAAYAAVQQVHFEGMQYRRDIGAKAVPGPLKL